METIATRIIKLCDVFNISKSDFARRINVTPSYISKLGKSTESVPSDRTIDDICRVFGVSKLWLKTGEGDMFPPRTQDEQIAAYVASALHGDEALKSLVTATITTLCTRQPSELEALLRACQDFCRTLEAQKKGD